MGTTRGKTSAAERVFGKVPFGWTDGRTGKANYRIITNGQTERGSERERELRTLLLKDKDFRHLPIFTICPC